MGEPERLNLHSWSVQMARILLKLWFSFLDAPKFWKGPKA
jgi:hypothetical protein